MKRSLLLTLAMLCIAGMAFAQAGSLTIAADPGGTNCNLADTTPGLCTYYVVHVNTPGATASQFYAPQPACMLAVYLSDGAVYPVTIGSSQTGVAIGYGACLPGPNNVLMINYFCQGLTPPCCYYPILPDPALPSGNIEVVDCQNQLLFATGGEGIVNSNQTCNCSVPVEETTWGGIKSLYQ